MNDTKRISLLGVIVEDNTASDQINKILHAYSEFIVGRMGIQIGRASCRDRV